MIALLKNLIAKQPTLEIGRSYQSQFGETRTIVRHTKMGDTGYWHGFEFVDDRGDSYLPDGRFYRDMASGYDLIL